MPAPLTTRRRMLRAVLVSLAALVGALALAEGGLRAWLAIRGQPYDSQATAKRLREMLSPIQAFVPGTIGTTLADGKRRPILHPYYAGEEEHDAGGVLAHFRERAQPEDFEIVVVGGSVAAFFVMTEGERLAEELGRDARLAGKRVIVLNGAHPAHKQPQQLNRIALLFALGYRPEVVLNLDGFNEVAIGAENGWVGANPAWPGGPVWGAVVLGVSTGSPERMDLVVELWGVRQAAYGIVKSCLERELHRSALLGKVALARIAALARRRAELQTRVGELESVALDERMRRQVGGPDFEPGPDAILDLCARVWSESSRSLRALCESRGTHYLHVLQPALYDEGSKPRTPAELAIQNPGEAWLVGARDGYPRLRPAGEALRRDGEHFVDASRAFVEVTEQVYVDPCHLAPNGNAVLRGIIARSLVEEVLPR